MTRIAMNICRIERICDTSSNSVNIDERIRNTLLGNGVFFASTFTGVVVVDVSRLSLLIVAKSKAGTTCCLLTVSSSGTSAVFLISEENSSRRVPI